VGKRQHKKEGYNMLKRYYRTLRDTTMGELDTFRSGVWVHLETPTNEEVSAVVAQYDLTPGHLEDALDEDEVPRVEIEGEQIYFYVRFALRDKDGEFATVPLLIVLVKNALITVTSKHVSALDVLTNGRVPIATTQKNKLLLLILQRITEQYDYLIDKTSRKIQAVRQRLRTQAVTNDDFVDFVSIDDELNEFLSSLQPNNASLRRLLSGHHLKLYEEDKDLVEDLLLTNDQSIEKCNENIRSIVGVRDAHSSMSDNSLNQTMKVLTVATLCMAIPNMFFGIYSMNIVTPFQHSQFAFFIIVGFTLLVTLLFFLLGRRKRIF